jgi:hypothetical protein
MELKDITGQKFGRLTVLKRVENIRTAAAWLCKCDCGNEVVVVGNKLRSGHTQSCTCSQKDKASEANKTHGRSKDPIYRVWRGMKERCNDPKHISYPAYGALGIKVCERWINSFENFITDMGERPEGVKGGRFTIERFDVNGDYGPNNCFWATYVEQGQNIKKNVWVEHDGKRMILADWARHFKINPSGFYYQLKTKTLEEVMQYYADKRKSI